MGRVVIANAFALSMLPLDVGWEARVAVRRLDVGEFKRRVETLKRLGYEIDCAIGHESTAKLVEQMLGFELECSRKMVTLEPWDMLYAVVLSFRPPEGKIYTEEELKELAEKGRIAFYSVTIAEW